MNQYSDKPRQKSGVPAIMKPDEKECVELRRKVAHLVRALPYEKLGFKQRCTLAINALPEFLDFPVTVRCEIVDLHPRTYYHIMHQAKYRDACDDFIDQVWNNVCVEMQARYIFMARQGHFRPLERILEQTKGLDRPAMAGATLNLNLNQTIITETRDKNISNGMEKMGYRRVETLSDN